MKGERSWKLREFVKEWLYCWSVESGLSKKESKDKKVVWKVENDNVNEISPVRQEDGWSRRIGQLAGKMV